MRVQHSQLTRARGKTTPLVRNRPVGWGAYGPAALPGVRGSCTPRKLLDAMSKKIA